MSSSLIAVTFILNSAFSIQVSSEGIEVVEYCHFNIDGTDQGYVVGNCSEEGEMLVDTWQEKHPDKPWRLVINNLDYNLM